MYNVSDITYLAVHVFAGAFPLYILHMEMIFFGSYYKGVFSSSFRAFLNQLISLFALYFDFYIG